MARTATDTAAANNGAAPAESGPAVGQPQISGGHLVAKALKAEGVDTIFTLCGGHIIDIYDGCVDEGIAVIDVRHEQVAAHAADGYARITGKPGCAVVTAGPGTHRRGDRRGERVARGEPDAAHRRPGRARPAQDGLAAGPAARRHDDPDQQVRGHRALDRPGRRHGVDGLPRVLQRRPRTRPSWRSRGTCWTPRSRSNRPASPMPATTARRPAASATRPTSRSWPTCSHTRNKPVILLGSQVWTTRGSDAAINLVRALDIPAYMNGAGRGTLPPGDPNHYQLSRRYAFDNADVIVIVGTPFDFRMGYGRRLSPTATVVQIDLDYRTVGKNRDISLGIVGDAGLVLAAVAASGEQGRERARRAAGLAYANCATSRRRRAPSGCRNCSPTPTRSTRTVWCTRSTSSSPRTPSTSATAATSSPSPVRSCSPNRPATGWTRARWARSASASRSCWRPSTRGRTRRSSRCSVTARSASPAGTSKRWSATTCRSSGSSATTPR